MFFACRVRLVFRDKSERTATKDHGGVAAIALCPDTLRGSCSGRESAIKLFQTAVSCRPSRHSPCCERLLTLPLLSMSWTFLLKVWPLFRCSCMAAFGCSLRLSNTQHCACQTAWAWANPVYVTADRVAFQQKRNSHCHSVSKIASNGIWFAQGGPEWRKNIKQAG